MSDELQFHLAARANDLVERRGVSSEEARRIARLEFGSQLASIDFFTVPTATFRVLFVFVVCRTTGGASST